jgi:hypothetical protein
VSYLKQFQTDPIGWNGLPNMSTADQPFLIDTAGTNFKPNTWQQITGYRDPASGAQINGMGGLGLGVLQGLGNAYMGMKQYGLAKDALKQNQQQFAKNYEAQRGLTNARLEGKNNALLAGNGGKPTGGMRSTEEYMREYGVKA